MKSMFPRSLVVGAFLPLLFLSLALCGGAAAQAKKKVPQAKPAAGKTAVKKAVIKKDRDKSAAVANVSKKEKAKEKAKAKAKETALRDSKSKREKAVEAKRATAARDVKNEKGKVKETAGRDSKSKKEKAAEAKRVAAERRRVEAERQAAILAERRRREQAAREARERRLAFERGLRTETVANIAADKTEGEDLAIRKAAIDALGSHAGSVVVMEAQTGKVLTIVNQGWAVRSSIKPCSTIKLVTGVAGLKEKVINMDNGAISAVRMNLDDALARSNNPYFQRVGAVVGNEKMIDTAKKLGLGEPTGVNVDGETAGRLAIGNNNGRIYSHGDDFEVSTVQLAVMVSAISNGGNRVLPRVPRNAEDDRNFQAFYRGKVDLPRESVRRVIPGMIGAAEWGTARRGVDANLGVAGKTGSCIGKGSWVGLFASVAPIELPKYAVVVITRGERERGRYAAAIAGKIYQALAPRIVRTDRNLAQTEFKLPPRGGVIVQNAVASADEEADEEMREGDGNIVGEDGRPVIVVRSAPQQKKLVTKTGASRPVFPPVVITFDKDAIEKKPTPVIKP